MLFKTLWYQLHDNSFTIQTKFPSQKLVVIGGTVETARRASISAWNGFVDCVFAHFVVKPGL